MNPYIMSDTHFPLNTPFKPSPSLITWFRVDFLLLIAFLMATSYAPVALFGDLPLSVHGWILGGIIIGILLFFVWVSLYYQSMWYELREDEISWKRGVWFRKTGIVPYSRITNLDIRQGPVMRALHISTLSIQTAGYSGQAVSEIRIEAIVYAEELRELIRAMVRIAGKEGDGTGTAAPRVPGAPSIDREILEELRKIRSLLERER
jgi:membrane protein YdbS with pleckstrin-like domain